MPARNQLPHKIGGRDFIPPIRFFVSLRVICVYTFGHAPHRPTPPEGEG